MTGSDRSESSNERMNYNNPHLADLALEVQLHILRFCSPQDLAILSRVHSSLRDTAEYVLYSHINFRPDEFIFGLHDEEEEEEHRSSVAFAMDNTSLLLSTLASNARKASTVKAFYINLDDIFRDDIPLILVELAGVLKKMVNLVDLRIMIYAKQDRSYGKISKVIRGGYFKLHTLYLDYYRELGEIIACQSQLRFLGLYHDHGDLQLVSKKLKGLHLNKHRPYVSSGPAIFTIESYYTRPITMFPAFHLPGEVISVFREISAPPKYYEIPYELSLSFLGISEYNISLFCEAIDAMAICAHHHLHPGLTSQTLRIIVHETTLQKPWLSPEFIKSLAQFEIVLHLHLYFPTLIDAVELHPLSTDLQECLLKDLGHGAWARLQTISLRGSKYWLQ
ncbi:hypothetical protein F5887DRAFT_932641, partial [Amanita rubescens]